MQIFVTFFCPESNFWKWTKVEAMRMGGELCGWEPCGWGGRAMRMGERHADEGVNALWE